MEKQIKLKGTILGVDFDLVVSGGHQPEKVTGTAGTEPVYLKIDDSEDTVSLSGSLLGKPVDVTFSK